MTFEKSLGREETTKTIEAASYPEKFWILFGKAGSGKTSVMDQLASQDFYPLHSSRLINKTVCNQTLFESLLAKELTQKALRFIVEDKGRKVAHLSIPEKLLDAWQKAPHFEVEASLNERVENIFNSHIKDDLSGERHRLYLESKKDRVGEFLFSRLKSIFDSASKEKDPSLHKDWIRLLLVEHLDPVFEHYKHHKNPNIVIKGSASSIVSQLRLIGQNIKDDETKNGKVRNEESSEKRP